MRRIFFALFMAISAVVTSLEHAATTGVDLYLDLMKKILTNMIYEDPGFANLYKIDRRTKGLDHPLAAHTMIGLMRLNNIQYCLEEILKERIPGDCIETGVWRGGATIFMRAILKAYGDETRKVWVADSFEGLPPPDVAKYPQDRDADLYKISYLSVPLTKVQNNFRKYGLLDDQVIFLKGFFRDTLPTAPIERLSLLRLDGDLYESTIEALEYLYPKLSVGGFLIVDDFGSNSTCEQAVIDYRRKYHVEEPMIWIDSDGVYWKKMR